MSEPRLEVRGEMADEKTEKPKPRVRAMGCVIGPKMTKKGKSFLIKIELPKAKGEKRKQFYRRIYCRNRTEAREELLRLRDEKLKELESSKTVEAEKASTPEGMTLNKWASMWLQSRQGELAGKSFERYGELLRNHVLPTLGHLPLTEIKRGHLKNLYRKLRGQGESP